MATEKNLWILTEERPKLNVIEQIVSRFAADHSYSCKSTEIKIIPLISGGVFTFTYEVRGIICQGVDKIYIKTVSGSSSFVDFLIFHQKGEPTPDSKPLYAIEETKTDDTESRNTGVFQRGSKFVFVEFFFPSVKKIMLYNIQIPPSNTAPTKTNIFGTRMLLTMGVDIMGKDLDRSVMKPFESVDELIRFKNSMRMPPAGNVPILIEQDRNKISVSGRLYKSGGLSHDPNIGALSMISRCIRKWENKKDIVITHHGLQQRHLARANKFVVIANYLSVKLDGLTLPKAQIQDTYWNYAKSQEKIASIFVHLIVENYTQGRAIYENHGGSERGYFFDRKRRPLAIPKYQSGQRASYKGGNKRAIIAIPDLILYDQKRNQIINIEGKTFSNRERGIEELKNYDYIEDRYIKPAYRPSKIVRTVVLFGSKQTSISKKEIGFLLNEEGVIVINENTPEIIKEAVKNLLSSQ